ncbi:hypothetical protein ACFFP0_14025 [Rhizobium puerariae]|uniref:Uncharacterized protein n=1 Tax=Rhizobium puerariae TaxID=1585791 RepID=A0ABV6AJW1_9HYPH
MKGIRISAELLPETVDKRAYRKRIENIHEEVASKRPKSLPYGYRPNDIFASYEGNFLAVKLSNTLTNTENGYVRQGLSLEQIQLLQLERLPPDVVRSYASAVLNMIDGPDPLE